MLIRDPSDETYPVIDPLPEDPRELPWNYWRFDHYTARDELMFELGAGLVYFDQETEQWDYVQDSIIFDGENQYLYPTSNASVSLPSTWRRGRQI